MRTTEIGRVAAVVLLLTVTALVPLALLTPAHGPAAPAASPPTRGTAAAIAPATPSSAPVRDSGIGCTPTPGGTPNWANDPNFFDDALVTFSVPGDKAVSGSNFDVMPCDNVIPTYTLGFWMNVTTNVPLTAAYVKIWGTGWPTPSSPSPDITGFSPADPTTVSMVLNPATAWKTASFYFNDYRFFWPGDQVYFNLTLISNNATPSTIYSAQGAYYEPIQWSGGYNNATWLFYVASPFSQTPLLNGAFANFSQVMTISTTPDTIHTPRFEPNEFQQVQIFLTGVNISGTQFVIPKAQLSFTLSGTESGSYADQFTPGNHSFQQLTQALGPYPGASVQYNVTAWLPWQGGAIDRIYSPVYAFNWTNFGGFPPGTPTLTDSLELSSLPFVTSGNGTTDLSTGTPVNISIHEPVQNITIGSAAIHFEYTDPNGSTSGTLPMSPVGQNTSYAIIPGLPPQSTVNFSVEAKDIFGNPLSTGVYSYREQGALNSTIAPGYGLFYFEAIDLSTGLLVPNLNFTLANSTWSESRTGTALGFGAPTTVGGQSELPVSFGTYTVTVSVFGQTRTWVGSVSSSQPFMVAFYVASGNVTPTYAAPVSGLGWAAVFGLVGATGMAFVMWKWFAERRKKIEAEQRRISL